MLPEVKAEEGKLGEPQENFRPRNGGAGALLLKRKEEKISDDPRDSLRFGDNVYTKT